MGKWVGVYLLPPFTFYHFYYLCVLSICKFIEKIVEISIKILIR